MTIQATGSASARWAEAANAFAVEPARAPGVVVVALSGGVDSAVAAWLLKEAGHDVVGVSLRLAPDDAGSLERRQGRCCSADDLTDARQLCEQLGVEFHAIDARERFREQVFDPFVSAYVDGQTPIPCLACNHDVKFGDLHRTAVQLGARLATGHYARVTTYAGHIAIARPLDRDRDQTYYLYGTRPEVIANLELPLGELEKPLVRALAERADLAVSDKPDSQEICFVPDGDHARVVERSAGEISGGAIVHVDGTRLGEHRGVHHYTVGQRRGLRIAAGERLYVLDVDGASQQVTVGPPTGLDCTQLKARELRGAVPVDAWPSSGMAQIRARHDPVPATFDVDGEELVVHFEEAVRGVAPGQAVVLYDGDVLLGGGLIAARLDGAVPTRRPLAVL